MWHDHNTIFGHGYIFITVRVLYDPAVFLTQEEINQQYPSITNIQALIETPEIHMVGVSSSGHAVLIPDRLPCIQELSDSVHTSSGIEMKDTLRFFKGDVPARSFERGTQQGGTIWCGGCGVRSDMTSDTARTKSLIALPSRATGTCACRKIRKESYDEAI